MFCVNCGKAYKPFYKFCNHCGYPLSSNVGRREGHDDAAAETPDSIPFLVSAPAIAMSALQSAPYATFVSLVLGSTLFISVVVFNVADWYARSRWEATISTSVAIVAAVLLSRSAWGAWRRVIAVEPETDAVLKRRHRRLLRNSAIIILLFFISAAAVGAAIGQNRAEAMQLAADLAQMNTVGVRITKARSAVEATFPSYVQMYTTIEPDVQELDSTFRRLKTELALYDGKFPAQHDQTSKSITAMETGLQRMALLKQQIEVSKHLQAIDPTQQVAVWKTQMQPLLDSEQALR